MAFIRLSRPTISLTNACRAGTSNADAIAFWECHLNTGAHVAATQSFAPLPTNAPWKHSGSVPVLV